MLGAARLPVYSLKLRQNKIRMIETLPLQRKEI